jgi:hypothetical protein
MQEGSHTCHRQVPSAATSLAAVHGPVRLPLPTRCASPEVDSLAASSSRVSSTLRALMLPCTTCCSQASAPSTRWLRSHRQRGAAHEVRAASAGLQCGRLLLRFASEAAADSPIAMCYPSIAGVMTVMDNSCERSDGFSAWPLRAAQLTPLECR